MKRTISITLLSGLLLLTGSTLRAQTPLEEFLRRVAEESVYVGAERAGTDARIAETHANNNLENPEVSYEYTPGIQDTEGAKQAYGLSQSFAWPGEYAARAQVNRLEREQAETDFRAARQDLLLRAKLLCYDLVYAHKRQELLAWQQGSTEKILASVQKQLEQGEATALDVNNARIGFAQANRAWASGILEIESLKKQLALLAGFDNFDPAGFDYENNLHENLSDILDEATRLNPELRSAALESQKSAREVSVARGGTLPSFSIGVVGERLSPTDNFLGVGAGLSIPLWGGAGKVKAARSQQLAAEYRERAVQTDVEANLTELGNSVLRLSESLRMYDELKDVQEAKRLLSASIEYQQIPLHEYYANLGFYTGIELEYLELEWQLYRALAELTKYRL